VSKNAGSKFTVHGSRLGLASVAFVLLGMLTAAAGEESPAAAIKVGEETVLLADGPGKGQQDTPAVAFGKAVYLVVWTEGAPVELGRARILATRLSPEGKVLDPKAIEVAPNKNADGPQTCPRVAFCKDVFLVVWQDFRNGKDYDVLGARISPEGKVLDAEPIKVAAGGGTQAMPDVATDGNGFMVVFQAHPESPKQLVYKTLAVPVGVDGRVGQQAEVMEQPHPKIAWDGANYLVVAGGTNAYFIGGRMFTRLVGPDGQPKAKMGEHAAGVTPQARYSISAQPGKGWFLATNRVNTDAWGWNGPGAMMCYFVTSEGKMAPDFPKPVNSPQGLQPGWLDVLDKDGGGIPWGPNASAWDGQHFVVVWQRFHRGSAPGFAKPLTNCDLRVGLVDGWKPVDPSRVEFVANSPDGEQWPALACEGPGKLLCVYTKSTSDGKVSICARTLQTQ